MSEQPLKKLLYVVSRFPSLTTTFTAYEMSTIQEAGVDVHVATVWSSEEGEPQTVEKQFVDKICDLRLGNPALWLRSVQQILIKPQILILIFQLLVGHLISVYAMLKLLVSLPKGLYLGYWVKKHGFQHIHAHFLSSPATVALIASRISGVPYTVTIHAFDIFATTPYERNASIPLKCDKAAACIVISKFNLEYMRRTWPDIRGRFELIYNGIDVDLFTNKTERVTDPNVFHILSNGRLVYTKGHTFLLEAVAKLRKKNRNVKLQIIGGGPLESELHELADRLEIKEHVTFTGKMLQEEIIQRYRASDLFVLACAISPDGDMDGLPVVLVEALAMEIPTVSTQVSGVPEIVQDKVTGLCVPPHDSQALADAIAYMMDHPGEASKMARAGRQVVAKQFNRHESARMLLQLWQTL
ncbi:glycosyltransferase family 4 protein [Tabrizicola sp. BL-A-41-H6]|uniref:glycosyltransferase family 4 protein n=1 Tax=Tabrizicola sp. BL-A-41-H6 TaxID=3421107 RepID=UPI003D6798DC